MNPTPPTTDAPDDMHPGLDRVLRWLEAHEEDPDRAKAAFLDFWSRWQARYVPPMYRAASLDTLTELQSPAAIRGWLANRGARNLFLAGPPGTGKTYAAYALACEEAMTEGATRPVLQVAPVAWSLASLLDALRPQSAEPESVWERAKGAPLLILDDLAHTRPTDWASERVWMLADHRTSHNLRTILTTNASASDLANSWGVATMDRFKDAAVAVKMMGESRRGLAW